MAHNLHFVSNQIHFVLPPPVQFAFFFWFTRMVLLCVKDEKYEKCCKEKINEKYTYLLITSKLVDKHWYGKIGFVRVSVFKIIFILNIRRSFVKGIFYRSFEMKRKNSWDKLKMSSKRAKAKCRYPQSLFDVLMQTAAV